MVNQKLAADGLAVDDGQLAVDAERLQDEGDEVGEEVGHQARALRLAVCSAGVAHLQLLGS